MSSQGKTIAFYQRIEEDLREKILGGVLEPHDRVPSDNELAKLYGVSRMTVRKAMTRLEYEGLIYRQPGRGTFVSERKIPQPISPVVGFSEKMEAAGYETKTKVLETGVIDSTKSCRQHLRLPEEAKIFRVVRLRFVNDEPAAIQTNFLPLDLFPGISFIDFHRPFSGILREVYGIEIKGYVSEVQPVSPTEEEQELLGLKKPKPLLLITSISFDQNHRPIRFSKGLFRGDKFSFVTNGFQVLASKEAGENDS